MGTPGPHKSKRIASATLPDEIPSESIAEPGCYVCNWSGHLLRVLGADAHGDIPLVSIVGSGPLTVTKISDNPYLPLSAAVSLAEQVTAATPVTRRRAGRRPNTNLKKKTLKDVKKGRGKAVKRSITAPKRVKKSSLSKTRTPKH